MTDPSSGLVVRSLSRRFGRRWVLARVSLEVPRGSALMLLGPNGSGKTTLLRCLATALKPHDGGATFDGVPLWPERHTLRRDIALLSHATALYDDLSARENLSAWARMGAYDADVDALLARVGLADTGARPTRDFSAGMKRRLALAKALVKTPRLLLLDEPFSALDPHGRALMGDVIDEILDRGATMVLTTHHPGLGARFCPQAVRLTDGQVTWRGPSSEAQVHAGDA
ncbi:MAG: heme ABC exporter ATP-binding protein CcmA [Alphaproteobacteria bacterium]|nr:heme ABC exporter ATP-binding protein CcmA [Alphaproteobacteria bacterium]